MKSFWCCCCLVLLLAMGACKYSPTDTHEVSVSRPSKNPGLNVVILDDSVLNVIRNTVSISFQSILNGHHLQQMQVFLDTVLIGSSTDSAGSFSFYSPSYADGNYTLRVVLIASTNTGSLADRLGAESYVVTRSYRVQLFNAPVTAPVISNIDEENGLLTLHWAQFTQPGFERYLILRASLTSDTYLTIGAVTNPAQTSFVDSTFMGIGLYIVQTYFAGTFVNSYAPEFDGAHFNFILSVGNSNSDNSVHLTWPKCPYPHGFLCYNVMRNSALLGQLYNINDTVFVDSAAIFGQASVYMITDISRLNQPWPNSTFEFGGPPEQFIRCSIPTSMRYFAGLNSLVEFVGGDLFEFNAKTLQLTANTYQSNLAGITALAVSDDGQHMYILHQTNPPTLNVLNSSTFDVEDTNMYPLARVPGASSFSAICVANSNLLAAGMDWSRPNAMLAIFDMNTFTLLDTLRIPGTTNGTSLGSLIFSANGEWVIAGQSLCKFSSGKLSRIGPILSGAVFSNDTNSIIQFSITGNNLQTLRCSDLAKTADFALNPGGYTLGIDRASGLVSYLTGNGASLPFAIEIYDAKLGVLRASVPLANQDAVFQDGYLFGNNCAMKVILH